MRKEEGQEEENKEGKMEKMTRRIMEGQGEGSRQGDGKERGKKMENNGRTEVRGRKMTE